MDPQLAVKLWSTQHRKRDAFRRAILAGDPPCALRIKCQGARATTVDHIRPLSLGGEPFDLRNGRPACGPCNFARGNGTRTPRSGKVRRPVRTSLLW